MKRILRNSAVVFSIIVATAFIMSFSNSPEEIQDVKEWKVPAEYNDMKNPTKASAEDINIGKTLYVQHCKSCHGKTGEGDGPKAEELDTFSGDFTMADFQAQTDGALFYKTKEGRDEMPAFNKKLSEDEDVWLIVNYMRTMDAGN